MFSKPRPEVLEKLIVPAAESSLRSRPAQPRIAITGIGMVTPFGIGRDLLWQRLLEGERAVACDRDVSSPRSPLRVSAEQPVGRVPLSYEGGSRLLQLARLAVHEAVDHARLTPISPPRTGCVLGTSKLDLNWFDAVASEAENATDCSFLFPSTAASTIAAEFGVRGATLCPIAACATGLVSLIRGADLIRSGDCDVVIAGSADSSLHPGLLASYRRLGVLAQTGDDPAGACRPFDRDRSGFVVGEGAGVLILEDWDHANQRGATILAEWIDGHLAGEASGLTSVEESGRGLSQLIQRVLASSASNEASASRVNAICVHGTGTRLNDLAESRALLRVFGEQVHGVPCFGIKGAIGHLLGAAGAVEAAASVMALQHGWLPPSANHRERDPACGIGLTQRPTRPDRLDTILKLSLGFGGQLAAALLRRVE